MRPLRLIFLSLACLMPVWLPLTVRAVEPTAADAGTVIYPRSTDPKPAPAGSAQSGAGSTGLIVTALLMATAGGWLFWRSRNTPGAKPGLRHLSIAETKALGNRQYLVVAAYQDKKFLLGVCPGRIDLLTALDDKPGSRPS